MMEKSNIHNDKNRHVQWRSMSLRSSQGRTHATPDDLDLRLSPVELEHGNRHQGSFFKTEAIIKDSGKRMEDDGFKRSALCMCLPGFGKEKPGKARKKGSIQMDHSVNPVMSSTFSLKNFELNSGVSQGITVQENNEDNSISSYFDLPSVVLKCSGDGA